MSIIETLVEKFPVRKSGKQKAAFRAWFQGWAQAKGYEAQETKAKGLFRSTNVVVGDPETAEVTFTAHYDTPAVMPLPNFITPRNVLVYILYQLVLVPVLLLPGALTGALTGHVLRVLTDNAGMASAIGGFAGFIMVYVALGVMMFGPANKHNVNDNTSGVAAVMELMARLPEELRGKAAFILFDNEEKGMLGSAAYAAEHKAVKKEKLIINMDCVGDGENILFFANKKTRELEAFPKLEAAMQGVTGRNFLMNKMENCIYPSDQAQFKLGIAVCACNRMPVIGYYCDKIHTKKDTVCEQVNLDFLAEGLTGFVSGL
ncbi:MAG: M28 family peptidase [Clostridia bacterium]|nr:M28 family peptidase [Clostridia bacterium]MBQ7139532.1 M28 family peptidase [Clostridia bacterium]